MIKINLSKIECLVVFLVIYVACVEIVIASNNLGDIEMDVAPLYNSHLQQVPTHHILQNVFAISTDKTTSCGSCFSYPSGEVLYLITASHVIKSMPHGVEGKIYSYKGGADVMWEEHIVTPYFANERSYNDGSGDIDIAVIKTSIPVNSNPWVELTFEGATLGQDVNFLGFPYFGGSISYAADSLNRNFPFPLVKKATLSSLPQNRPYFFLDGHNNPGFSGGPVTFWDSKSNKQKVLGVISSYLTQRGEIKPVETSFSQLFYQENSGIAVAYNIKYAKDIIDKINRERT